MWLYLGIVAASLLAGWYYNKIPTIPDTIEAGVHTYTVTKEVCKVIRRNGLGVCLKWTQQVIANQIGNRLVEMHHRYYVIHYPYGVTWYKIIVPRRRGPCKIDTVVDQDGKDVKKDVFAYMGPSHNFHGVAITPKMLGYESLTFTDIFGDARVYTEEEVIAV